MSTSAYDSYDAWKQWPEAEFLRCGPQETAYFAGELAGLPLGGCHVLELGFGNGSFLGFARARGATVYGTEVIEGLVERAGKAGIPTLSIDLSDAGQVLKAPLDLVVALDVLEHLTHDEIRGLFARLAPLVKPGGHVVARFPNAQSPFSLAHQNGDHTHRSTLSGPMLGQLLLGTPWRLVRSSGPFRVQGRGLAHGLATRAKYAAQSMIQIAGNRIYGLDILWAPNVVVRLHREANNAGSPHGSASAKPN